MKKYNKFCKLYGVEIEHENDLTDQEVRLYHIFLRVVDWDMRHQSFGFIDMPIRDFKKTYLPVWSTGKICEVQNSLIRKGWLEKGDHGIGIRGYAAYRIVSYQEAEQAIRGIRQGVHLDEHAIRQNERHVVEAEEIQKAIMATCNKASDFPVQPFEQVPVVKNT